MVKRFASAAVFVSASIVFGCGYDGPSMTVGELHRELEKDPSGILLLDVRSPIPYKNGHVPGAVNVPLERIAVGAGELASEKRRIAVICTCGKKALRAATHLQARGIDAILITGGTKAWKEAGYSVEKAD